jgi:hypothetical protein
MPTGPDPALGQETTHFAGRDLGAWMRSRPAATALLAVGVIAVLGVIDYGTGPDLTLAVLYLLPITLVAWSGDRDLGVAMAAMSAACQTTADALWPTHTPPPVLAWNGTSRFLVYTTLVVLLTALRKAYARSEERRHALEEAQAEIKTLRGLLPICSFCHRIRDDDGEWERLEAYIHSRTDATFTHGMCPECIRKNYPDVGRRLFPEPGEASEPGPAPSVST